MSDIQFKAIGGLQEHYLLSQKGIMLGSQAKQKRFKWARSSSHRLYETFQLLLLANNSRPIVVLNKRSKFNGNLFDERFKKLNKPMK